MSTSNRRIADLETPAVVVNLEQVRENIKRVQKYADQHGLKLRPHVKTHKLPTIAKMQLDAGAVGLNCQKVSEAWSIVEGLSSSIRTDILISFNVVGRRKLDKLMRLSQNCTKLTVSADSPYVVNGYIEAAQRYKKRSSRVPRLNVMVECDTGNQLTGVKTPAEALDLAQTIVASNGILNFAGLTTYHKAGTESEITHWFEKARALFEAANLPIPEISLGGTSGIWKVHEIGGGITEIRPGSYVYNDRSIIAAQAAQPEWIAMRVLATIVSRRSPTQVLCDAGSKVLSNSIQGFSDYGLIAEYRNARLVTLTEEFGIIEADTPEELPQLGEPISIIPNHATLVSNLFDVVNVFGDLGISEESVIARGKLQ